MTGQPIILDGDYIGPRWRYWMLYRPPGIGCQPHGAIIGTARRRTDANGWTLDYPRELTQAEMDGYQLQPMGRVA